MADAAKRRRIGVLPTELGETVVQLNTRILAKAKAGRRKPTPVSTPPRCSLNLDFDDLHALLADQGIQIHLHLSGEGSQRWDVRPRRCRGLLAIIGRLFFSVGRAEFGS